MIKWCRQGNPLCIKTESAVKLSQGIFFFTYATYLALNTAIETTYRYDHSTKIFSQGVWVCCFLALISIIFLCRYSTGQLIGIILFLGFYFFIWFNIGKSDAIFLQSMILVFSCREVKWKHVLEFSFIAHTLLILIPALFEQIGLLPSLELFRGGTARYSLGFSHPNVLGGYCLSLVIIWLLLRYQKLKFYDYLAWILIAFFLWMVPNSRTSTFLVLMICLFVFIFKQWGERLLHNRLVQAFSICFCWLMALFSIFASYCYNADSALYVSIDKNLFTTRLSCAHSFLEEYPVTIFGQKLKLVGSVRAARNGTQSYILDNFYVRQLLNLGIISLLIVLLIFTVLIYWSLRTQNQAMLISLIIIMIYCVYENHGANLVYNVLLFQVVYLLLAKKEYENDKSISDCTCL